MIEVGDMVRIKRGNAPHTPYIGDVGQLIQAEPVPYGYTVCFAEAGPYKTDATICFHADEIEPAAKRRG